ncbi:MAG: 2-methylcitrate dehydratase, partial [Actinobacteria bacterium]|nr:2-methylcitrate dehydratase [Actinomycetota bacterium]
MQNNNLDTQINNFLSKPLKNDDHFTSAKLAILDTLGCIIEASSHDEVNNFAIEDKSFELLSNPFLNVGKLNSYQEVAWYLTVLTRWFDYNDTFLAKEWAHPSDNFGSIYSYFYANPNFKFIDFTTALTKAYEIQGSLCLGTSLNKLGYDHVFYVKLASGAVFSSLLSKGNEKIVHRTINHILLDGPSLRSYRHFPNVGKRKSWAAADASKRGIELAKISQLNDEVYSSIQDDKNWGFEKNYLNDSEIKFGKELNDWVIQNVLFKVLFPAEFHGQSAVEGAIELSKEFNQNIDKVKKINIFTHEPAIRIIANKENLSNASDRDHSLEYMVSAALLFGELKYEMYGNDFSGLNKIESLRKKIVVSEDSNFTKNYYEFSKRHISNSIEIVYDDNSTSEKITIENPIGHPSRREEAIPLLKEKFIRNVQNVLSLEKSMSLWEQVINLEKDDELTKFFN